MRRKNRPEKRYAERSTHETLESILSSVDPETLWAGRPIFAGFGISAATSPAPIGVSRIGELFREPEAHPRLYPERDRLSNGLCTPQSVKPGGVASPWARGNRANTFVFSQAGSP